MLMIQKELYLLKLVVPSNDSHCSQELSNDSRKPNTGTQIILVTRSNLSRNASINTQQQKVFDVICEWVLKKRHKYEF